MASVEERVIGRKAPELVVDTWIDGKERTLASIEEPFIILMFYQRGCLGCEIQGFPTLKRARNQFHALGYGDKVSFIAVQTVHAESSNNDPALAQSVAEDFGFDGLIVGHAAGIYPEIYEAYQAAGTPWTVLMGPDREILVEGNGPTARLLVTKVTAAIAELEGK